MRKLQEHTSESGASVANFDARQPVPMSDGASLQNLRGEAAHCKACDLWKHATQTVFGEGADLAALMLVGEQPGDKEDIYGHPFVGPAGKLLDEALQEA